jgi:hypothetical protein
MIMKTSISPFLLIALVLTMGTAGYASPSQRSAKKASPHNQPIQQIADQAVADAGNSHPNQ